MIQSLKKGGEINHNKAIFSLYKEMIYEKQMDINEFKKVLEDLKRTFK